MPASTLVVDRDYPRLRTTVRFPRSCPPLPGSIPIWLKICPTANLREHVQRYTAYCGYIECQTHLHQRTCCLQAQSCRTHPFKIANTTLPGRPLHDSGFHHAVFGERRPTNFIEARLKFEIARINYRIKRRVQSAALQGRRRKGAHTFPKLGRRYPQRLKRP